MNAFYQRVSGYEMTNPIPNEWAKPDEESCLTKLNTCRVATEQRERDICYKTQAAFMT